MERKRLIAVLRAAAAAQGKSLKEDARRGKGSHVKITVGDAFTFIPDRDIDPVTEKKIRKTLGL